MCLTSLIALRECIFQSNIASKAKPKMWDSVRIFHFERNKSMIMCYLRIGQDVNIMLHKITVIICLYQACCLIINNIGCKDQRGNLYRKQNLWSTIISDKFTDLYLCRMEVDHLFFYSGWVLYFWWLKTFTTIILNKNFIHFFLL